MDWTDLKISLVDKGLLPKLFVTALPSFGIAIKEIDAAGTPYLPRHADLLLRDLSSSCDRMTVYLKEWREMEIAAVKAATDRHIFLQSEEPDKELVTEQLAGDIATKRVELSAQVAQAFGNGDAIARGFSKDSEVRGVIAAIEESKANKQLKQHVVKWNLAREVSDAYWQRHQEHGNAHHFEERAQWAAKLLKEEAETALQKAVAIFRGVGYLYGITAPALPEKTSVHYFVEQMVSWTREMFRRLELEEQSDQEFEFTIPLVQKIFSDQSPPVGASELLAELQSAARENRPASLRFVFPNLPIDSRQVRLRAVAASFSTESDIKEDTGLDRAAQRLSYAKLFGKATLPPHSSPSRFSRRPPGGGAYSATWGNTRLQR